MVYTPKWFLEVAIESWPEWDSHPQPLNSVHRLQPTELSGHEFDLHSEKTLHSYLNFRLCSAFRFSFGNNLRHSPDLPHSKS